MNIFRVHFSMISTLIIPAGRAGAKWVRLTSLQARKESVKYKVTVIPMTLITAKTRALGVTVLSTRRIRPDWINPSVFTIWRKNRRFYAEIRRDQKRAPREWHKPEPRGGGTDRELQHFDLWYLLCAALRSITRRTTESTRALYIIPLESRRSLTFA